ncbi:hypothetical protein AURDEDRAFT_164892 [Auricularia subglabra TFB-10046 SS5]|nr:hypothetical protein AURDEDRAFT_164892 [Auricularia subglabra TFB-10046 SS5]
MSGYSYSTGYPGQRQQQQSYNSSSSSSYEPTEYEGYRFGEIAAIYPAASREERDAAVSRYTSATHEYPQPHHNPWDTPGSSPASDLDEDGAPRFWQSNTTPRANRTLHSAPPPAPAPAPAPAPRTLYTAPGPAPAPLLAPPTAGTPGHQLLRSPGDARHHYATVQPSGLRNEITATTPSQTHRGAPVPNYYTSPASQASSGARYNPPTQCNYCHDVVEYAQLDAHLRGCPRNPYRAQEHTGSRLPAPPVTVLAKHQWNAGGTSTKRSGNP